MQAVILAGGKGTRLRPYSLILPKPLMPIGEIPVLEVVIRQLRYYGFTRIKLSIGYLGELIKAYLGDGAKLQVEIEYCREEYPLGTAGPLKLIDGLDDDFLVINGDLLTSIDFASLVRFHRQHRSIATTAVYARQEKIELGVLSIEGIAVRDYIEKPTYTFHVSTGIYMLSKKVLADIPEGSPFDMPDLIKTLIGNGEIVTAFRFDGYWLDIGRPDDYEKAVQLFEEKREFFLQEG